MIQMRTGASKESIRLGASFFLFGLLNNSLYVVILAAALELLPQGVPTGVVAFANIFPALLAKAFWPYVLRGRVRYTRRVWSCTVISFAGMVVSARGALDSCSMVRCFHGYGKDCSLRLNNLSGMPLDQNDGKRWRAQVAHQGTTQT